MVKKKKKLIKKVAAPVKKQKTLREKINELVDGWKKSGKETDKLKEKIFLFVQKELYPDQFCPKCEERLFFGPTGWSCPNCGYTRQSNQTTTQSIARPSQTGKVPPQVEKMIKDTEKSRRVVDPTKKGKSIRELVDQMDTGGPSAPTPQDEAKVRRDPNVGREVNWV